MIACGSQYDVLIVGAGIAGLYMLFRMRELGLSARVIEMASGCGRHLVLESLSGRALRYGHDGIFLQL